MKKYEQHFNFFSSEPVENQNTKTVLRINIIFRFFYRLQINDYKRKDHPKCTRTTVLTFK